jgi:hypothetical protein
VKLVPYQFFEAVALGNMGKQSEAAEIYRAITNIKREYFSNMYLEDLPFYQAMAYARLGEKLEAELLMTKQLQDWQKVANRQRKW